MKINGGDIPTYNYLPTYLTFGCITFHTSSQLGIGSRIPLPFGWSTTAPPGTVPTRHPPRSGRWSAPGAQFPCHPRPAPAAKRHRWRMAGPGLTKEPRHGPSNSLVWVFFFAESDLWQLEFYENWCVWKCRVAHCTQWFCWSLSRHEKWLAIIGNMNPTFSDKPKCITTVVNLWVKKKEMSRWILEIFWDGATQLGRLGHRKEHWREVSNRN